MLTQEQLIDIFNYCPDSGNLIRRSGVQGCNAGEVAGYKNDSGYIIISVNYVSYRAHRLVWFYMTGSWPKDQIDHINHKRDDNRWVNLRESTNKQNQMNRTTGANNTYGVTGVSFHKASKKWRAFINVSGKAIHLGLFKDKFDAICSRLSANNKYGFHENHGR